MKRIDRRMSDAQRQKISTALTGRKLTPNHKKNLSNALRKYWESVPFASPSTGITMSEYLGIENNEKKNTSTNGNE